MEDNREGGTWMAVARTRSRFVRIEVINPLASILPVRPVLQQDTVSISSGERGRPVDVVDGVQREVEHDHVMDCWNVNSSRSDVTTDEILLAQTDRHTEQQESQAGKGRGRNLSPWFTTKEF